MGFHSFLKINAIIRFDFSHRANHSCLYFNLPPNSTIAAHEHITATTLDYFSQLTAPYEGQLQPAPASVYRRASEMHAVSCDHYDTYK